MRLYLINPSNPLASIVNANESRWNRYRVGTMKTFPVGGEAS